LERRNLPVAIAGHDEPGLGSIAEGEQLSFFHIATVAVPAASRHVDADVAARGMRVASAVEAVIAMRRTRTCSDAPWRIVKLLVMPFSLCEIAQRHIVLFGRAKGNAFGQRAHCVRDTLLVRSRYGHAGDKNTTR